jgi:hypothetical protein
VRVFWEPVVKPLLDAASPRVVVEVGTSNGDTTRDLLEFAAARDCTVHTIDPSPGEGFDADALRKRYGDRLVVHRKTSLESLPEIERIDAALLDGDHNWYTVLNELEALDEGSARAGHAFPLTFLHDVDWPYGRRDLYYDPETIPPEHRHPFDQAGMVQGRPALSEDDGVNASLNNAVAEGTPRNGVRTALEDFMAQTRRQLRFLDVPGFNGLGIVLAESDVEENALLAEELSRLRSPEWLTEHCRRIEKARLWTQVQANRELRSLRRAQRARAD